MSDRNIETGVDRLVEIVTRKKKVTINDAAKELGVSIATVQEWADFLEDEGLISVEDSLRKTYLMERKLSKGEVEKKSREYTGKKDAFIARVDTALSSLQRESEGLGKIKEEFGKLKEAIGSDIDLVKEELSELKHYEDLKKNMDKEILQQRVEYQEMTGSVRKKILEEKKQYEEFLSSIGTDKNKLEEARVELSFLEKKEETLQKRLEALQSVIKGISAEIDSQKKLTEAAVADIESKIKNAEKMKADMKSRVELSIEPVMKKMKDNEDRIFAVQNSLLKKIAAKHNEVNTYNLKSIVASEKFKSFFERRSHIQEMIEEIEKSKQEIEKDLKDLIQTAKDFNLSMKSTDTKKFVHELEGSMDKIEQKKSNMSASLGKLTEILKMKDQ